MPSDVDIVNLALVKLGANRITTLTDSVKEAREMNAIYALERDAEIGNHNWSFAAKRVLLPALTETPAYGYDFLYELPEDCLCVVRVGTPQPGGTAFDYLQLPASDYRLQGRRIETNLAAPLPLLYNARVTDPTLFDPLFVKALAARLAIECCEILTQSNTKKQFLAQDYREAIWNAITNDSIQEPPDPIPDDPWILARR